MKLARYKSKYNLDKGNFMNLKVPNHIVEKMEKLAEKETKKTWGEIAREILEEQK